MKVKKCPICNEVKSISSFDKYYSKERQKYRPQSYCKTCMRTEAKKRAKIYYKENKEKVLAYSKTYREKNEQVLREKSKLNKRKYRKILQDCYVRTLIKNRDNSEEILSEPKMIELYKANILCKRIKVKINKYGKK